MVRDETPLHQWKKILKNDQTLQSIICNMLQDRRELETPHFPSDRVTPLPAMFLSPWIN